MKSIPILYNGPPFPHQNCLFQWGIWTPSHTRFLWLTRVHIQKGISISSAVFAGLTITIIQAFVRCTMSANILNLRQTDQQSDHATRSVTIGSIYVYSTMMRPNNNNHCNNKSIYIVPWHPQMKNV